MHRLRCCLGLLLTLLATPVQAQRAAFTPASTPEGGPYAVVLRTAGALGGIVVAVLASSLVLMNNEDNVPDSVPPTVMLLVPIAGGAGGSYLTGRVTDTPGTFSGAVLGSAIGVVPGIVVLAASGSATDAETAGALLFVGGAAVGAAVGYGSSRLALGFLRAPGAAGPALRVRVAL